MGRGGARPGAGRKKGSTTKKTREIAEKAIASGMTPLDVMLEAMRDAYRAGGAVAAAEFAKDAAPYIHPKLSSTALKNDDGNPFKVELSDARSRLAEKLARVAKS